MIVHARRAVDQVTGKAGQSLRDHLDQVLRGHDEVLASPLADHLGCAFDDGPLLPAIRVDAMRQTTVPCVYAAGDAASPMHSVTLAIAAGVIAGAGAHQSLVAEAAGGAPAR